MLTKHYYLNKRKSVASVAHIVIFRVFIVRCQLMAIDGHYSNFTHVKSDAPQGSVLELLLFLLYTNDVWHGASSNSMACAEETFL